MSWKDFWRNNWPTGKTPLLHPKIKDYSCSANRDEVLWNNEMDLCVCLKTELSKEEFAYRAKVTHLQLTGESLPEDKIRITNSPDTDIYRLEVI